MGSYDDITTSVKISKAKQTQFYQVSHLVLRCIELLVDSNASSDKDQSKSLSILEEKTNKIRLLCNTSRPDIANALYNLLLDGLLYASNTTPSFGLSKNGHERLQSGTISSSALTWKQEYASSIKLKQLKMNLLDFITPTKKTWSIFFMQPINNMGVIRSIVLMLVASGDDHLDVSNYAMEYLKIYIDNYKNKSLNDEEEFNHLGDPVLLTVHLLSLVIGEVTSTKIFTENKLNDKYKEIINESTNKDWMRRMVSDKTITTIFNFISLRILEEIPQFSDKAATSVLISNLLLSASNYCFLNSSSSKIIVSSTSNNGGMNPRIAYIQLLNSFTIQFSKLYDGGDDQKCDLENILGKIVEISLSSLLSTSSSSSNNNEVNVRDACYGILCTLCRSNYVLCSNGTLFHGHTTTAEEEELKVSNLSTSTTSQLFHCVMYEMESLRPRAIATLDALLGAYLKVYDAITNKVKDDDNDIAQTSFNPWASTTPNLVKTTKTNTVEEEWKNVSNTLIPLLWNASTSKNKACKYASVQWSTKLLKKISYVQSCHLLCYLSGTLDDLNISNIAKHGLDNLIQDDENDATISSTELGQIISILFQSNKTSFVTSSQRPTYKDFTSKGKGITLRFILHNLLNDFYDTSNENLLKEFMNIVKESLHDYSNQKNTNDSLDFLEDCSYCLSICLSSSYELRENILEDETFNYKSMILLCLSSSKSSSKARRYLSNCCSYIFEDDKLWASRSYDLLYPMKICVHVLENNLNNASSRSNNGEIHGAAYLSGSCIRAMRVLQQKGIFDKLIGEEETIVNQYYDIASRIIFSLGKGLLLHTTTTGGSTSDESIAYACCDSIHVAFSSTTNTSIITTNMNSSNCCYYDNVIPTLNPKFYDSTADAIQNITKGLQKYGAGENTDAIRFTKLINASGSILSASTAASGVSDGGIGTARLNCVDMLFSLLGTSTASRKDPIIDLVIGEVFVSYADTIPTADSVIWSNKDRKRKNDEEYDADYARSLPPSMQVSFCYFFNYSFFKSICTIFFL